MKRQAFTLVELAIVLVVIGLLVGGGFKTLQIMSKRAKVTETRQKLDAAKEAIVGFVQTNGFLPNATDFATLVPGTSDSWTRRLGYHFDPVLAVDDVCYHGKSTLRIDYDCAADGSGCKNAHNAAFAIVSGGPNYNMQTQTAANVTTLYRPGQVVDANATDFTRAEDYDDLSVWMTLQQLRIEAGCDSAQVKISTDALPKVAENRAYNASLQFDGGIPFDNGGVDEMKWCYEGDLPIGSEDNITLTCNGPLAASPANTCLTAGTWQQCAAPAYGGTVSGLSIGTFTHTVYIRDDDGNTNFKTFTITAESDYPEIANRELPRGVEGGTYNATLAGTGGDGNYNFSQLSSSSFPLPSSVSLSSDSISGTVADDAAGTYPVTFQVTDGTGRANRRTFVITIDPMDSNGSGPISSSGSSSSAIVVPPPVGCASYNFTISNSGNSKSYTLGGGACQNLGNGDSRTASGLSGSESVDVRRSYWCFSNVLLSGTVASLDSNGDCSATVTCSGNSCSSN